MAHTPYTGKLYGATIKDGSTALPRWREIVIAEKGRPVAEQMDTTDSADTAWAFTDDPLGGKGSASATITVNGFKSKTAVNDADVLFDGAVGDTVTITFQAGTGAGADKYTLTNCIVKSLAAPADLATVVPYTVVYEQTANAGVWAASLS